MVLLFLYYVLSLVLGGRESCQVRPTYCGFLNCCKLRGLVMRVFCGVLLMVVLWCGVVVGGTNDSKAVLFLSSPAVDTVLAQECFEFMDKNVRGEMRVNRTLLRVKGFGPEEQLKAFSAMRSKNDVLVVVLVNQTVEKCPIVIFSEKLGTAVVNIAPILSAEGLSDKVRSARIDRAAMYALGRLAGMKACLNPFCALSEYAHVQKDKVPGRNYCPNCSDPVGKLLQEMGIFEKSEKMRIEKLKN